MENDSFEVRDLRRRTAILIDKDILFHPDIGASDYKVYNGLVAFLDDMTNDSRPGVTTLESKLHLSRNTVLRSFKTLEDVKAIRIERTSGMNNVYFLLDINGHMERKEKKKVARIGDGAEVNKVMEYFKGVNPNYDIFYKRTPEREALGRMIHKFGEQKMVNMIKYLPEICGKPFAPKITSPRQLETDLGKLLLYIKQNGGVKTEIAGL